MPVAVHRVPGPGRTVLEQALADLENRAAQVGWFSSSVYPSGVPVAYVAAIHEFGVPEKNIPPRMGLRGMVEQKRGEWATMIETYSREILNEHSTVDAMLNFIGMRAASDIFRQIASVTTPALADATIKARERRSASGEARTATGSKPLNDTGYLMASVSYMVSGHDGSGTPIAIHPEALHGTPRTPSGRHRRVANAHISQTSLGISSHAEWMR